MKKTLIILTILLGFSLTALATEKEKLVYKYNRLAYACYKARDYKEAIKYYDLVLENAETGKDRYLKYKADALMYDHQYAAAISIYDEVLAIRPWDLYTITNKASCLANSGDYDDAIATYRQANEVWTKAWKNVKNEMSSYHRGIIDEGIGRAYNYKSDYNSALSYADSLLKVEPTNRAAFIIKGDVYYKQKDYSKALDASTKLVEYHPKYSLGMIYQGINLHELKRYDEAIEVLKKALKVRKNDARTLNRLGWAYFDKGEKDKALDCYNKAIKADKSFYRSWLRKGYWMLDAGNKKEAKLCFEKVLEINPYSNEAQKQLNKL